MLVGFEPEGRVEERRIGGAPGLHGRIVKAAGTHRDSAAPIVFWTVILLDDRFRYVLRGETSTTGPDLAPLLTHMASTVKPIPRASDGLSCAWWSWLD